MAIPFRYNTAGWGAGDYRGSILVNGKEVKAYENGEETSCFCIYHFKSFNEPIPADINQIAITWQKQCNLSPYEFNIYKPRWMIDPILSACIGNLEFIIATWGEFYKIPGQEKLPETNKEKPKKRGWFR